MELEYNPSVTTFKRISCMTIYQFMNKREIEKEVQRFIIYENGKEIAEFRMIDRNPSCEWFQIASGIKRKNKPDLYSKELYYTKSSSKFPYQETADVYIPKSLIKHSEQEYKLEKYNNRELANGVTHTVSLYGKWTHPKYENGEVVYRSKEEVNSFQINEYTSFTKTEFGERFDKIEKVFTQLNLRVSRYDLEAILEHFKLEPIDA